MLKFQQMVILSLVAGLLLLQIAPANCRRKSRSRSRNGNGDGNGYGNGAVTPSPPAPGNSGIAVNVVDLTNFLIQGFFDFLIGILASIGVCIPQCISAADCISCFALTLPPPPALPAGIIDPGTVTVS